MIINIPLEVDEQMFNDVLVKDYATKIEHRLTEQVEAAIKQKCRGYYSKTVSDGLFYMVEDAVDGFIKEHKDEIIDAASGKLAERLAKTKAAKALLEVPDAY